MATQKKHVTPKNIKKNDYPKKFGVLLLRGGLLLHFGKMAYFIAYGFINAIQTLFSHEYWESNTYFNWFIFNQWEKLIFCVIFFLFSH